MIKTIVNKYNRLLILLLLIVAIMVSPVYGATKDENYAGNQLKQLGILKGYEDGSLQLDNSITRSEVATIMVRIRGYEGKTINQDGKKFSDVSSSYWGYNYIQNAYKLSIIQGYPDNSFKPLNNISYAEVVAIMVNALGYKDSIEGEWPNNYLNKAKEIGVIPSNSSVNPTTIITRGEMALIVWDTLLVKMEKESFSN